MSFNQKTGEPKSDDRLFKFILKCNRDHGKPDLHSFMVSIDGGRAFVECRGYEVYIEAHVADAISRFVGTVIAATNFLEARNADYSSIEM